MRFAYDCIIGQGMFPEVLTSDPTRSNVRLGPFLDSDAAARRSLIISTTMHFLVHIAGTPNINTVKNDEIVLALRDVVHLRNRHTYGLVLRTLLKTANTSCIILYTSSIPNIRSAWFMGM